MTQGTFAARRVAMPTFGWFAVAAVVFVASAGHAHADEEWKLVTDRRGLTLERRKIAGEQMPELRVTTHTNMPMETVAAAAWADRYDGKLTKKTRILRQVVSETANDRIQYNQVKVPVVPNRDYTLKLHKYYDGTGIFHLEIESIVERPPQPGFIRIPRARGNWTIAPTSDGGCDITYITYAEPGGMVPAFVIRGAQVDGAIELVEEVLDWAHRH